MKHLLCFGLGFAAKAVAVRLKARGWRVTASSRTPEGVEAIRKLGYEGFIFDGSRAAPSGVFDGVTHLLISAPPGTSGDPVLSCHHHDLAARAAQFDWVGYLSTTGVYGDHGGGWVAEDTPRTPNTTRGERRRDAEDQWLDLWRRHGLPMHIFRLAGIYGPGRNQLVSVLNGTAQRIIKPGQVFSRIHVEDIAAVIAASIDNPNPGRDYNVCDDEACPPQDVVSFAAQLLGFPEPPAIPFEQADLSPMARSFYADSKRVSNARIKAELGVALRYPTYREGLTDLARKFRR